MPLPVPGGPAGRARERHEIGREHCNCKALIADPARLECSLGTVIRALGTVIITLGTVIRTLGTVIRTLSSIIRTLSSIIRTLGTIFRTLGTVTRTLSTLSAPAYPAQFIFKVRLACLTF